MAWSLLDRLPENVAVPVLEATARRRAFWRRTYTATVTLAAAAMLAIGALVWWRPAAPSLTGRTSSAIIARAGARTVILSDGSVVQLNRGSEISEQFTPAARLVLLARGEAHFAVAKNPARPFIVRAGVLQIRAVGTAFNVNLQSAAVDVIVTEGRVQLATRARSGEADSAAPTLDAGHRAVLRGDLVPGRDLGQALDLSLIDPAEMARVLAWREPLLHLGGSTLAELAAEFERATGRRLLLADPSLADLRFGGRFRADDVEGFTHLIATTLDLEVERLPDGTILLRKKKLDSR
jgi:transmembrane sensor